MFAMMGFANDTCRCICRSILACRTGVIIYLFSFLFFFFFFAFSKKRSQARGEREARVACDGRGVKKYVHLFIH